MNRNYLFGLSKNNRENWQIVINFSGNKKK